MGIPGLLTQLEPYAVAYSSADLEGYSAIVDGPALAYFAHGMAAKNQDSSLPSYDAINTIAIRWLKSLEELNIKVSAILFDGALPPSKRDERLTRLQENVRRVTQLRSMYTSTGCPIPTQLGSIIYSLLAPALAEALRQTSFAHITRLVPGEADDWCACYAKNTPRSIIFTGDTDLVLYEYEPKVVVAFFKDLGILPISEIKVHSPTKISQQLKLKSLLHLAYAIHRDRWKSFSANLREAQKLTLDSSDYQTFSKRYVSAIESPVYSIEDSGMATSLQVLDVRVSEFVHQALSVGDSTGPDTLLCLTVFLPLLFEDPFQASAWKFGEEVRTLAFGLLTPGRIVVQEYRRKAQGVSVQEYAPQTQTDLLILAADLSDMLKTSSSAQELTPARQWILLALQLVLQTSKAPHISLAIRVVNADFDNTWAFVHLTACVQAALYSLRMLKQCLSVWLYSQHHAVSLELTDSFASLKLSLQSLPSIADVFTVPGQGKRLFANGASLYEAVKTAYTAAGLTDEALFQEPKSKKQRKREKRKRKAEAAAEPETPRLGNNAFALLEGDNSN